MSTIDYDPIEAQNRIRAGLAVRAARRTLGYTKARYRDQYGDSAAVAIEIMRRLANDEPLDGVWAFDEGAERK